MIYACRCGAKDCRGTMLWPAKRPAVRKKKKRPARKAPAASDRVPAPPVSQGHAESDHRPAMGAVVGALGIVYGDIGTSPLYAFDESLKVSGASNAEAILGVLSLIFWALAISVTIKYVVVMMRADNEGRGWHPRAAGAGAARLEPDRPVAAHRHQPGADRHRAVLLRCTDHARDFGAQRGRGSANCWIRPSAGP